MKNRVSLWWRTWICLSAAALSLERIEAQNNSIDPVAMHAVLSDGYFKPQSPDVWSMIKYGDANIKHYNGTLGLSIPVYTYKDPNFEIPVSIDYASSGFQPGSPDGVVGHGWYLNAGGAITREVRGIPDDAVQNLFDWRDKLDTMQNKKPWWDKYTFPAGHYVAEHSVRIDGYAQGYFRTTSADSLNLVYTGAAGQEFMSYWKDENQDRHGFETEPDIFHFKFSDYSGSFILQPDRQVKVFNTNKPAEEFDIEFSMSYSEPKTTSKFVIKTGDNKKYYFEHRESCQILSDISSPTDTGQNHTWKLTRIEAPNGDIVRFVYSHNYNTYETITPVLTFDKINNGNPESEPSPKYTISNSVNEYPLDSIVVENKAHIVFTYTQRNLTSVKVFNLTKETPIKTCCCSYFENRQGSGIVTFLKTVAFSGEGCYAFDYYDETAAFEHNHSFKVDKYGYFNNDDDYSQQLFQAKYKEVSEMLRTKRNPSESHTRMGMLKTVHYPAGGHSDFQYEQNEVFRFAENVKVGGLRVKQIDTFSKDGVPTQSRTFRYNRKENPTQSSGALSFEPCYYFRYSIIVPRASFDREIVSSLVNVGFSRNSFYEYLRVVEEVRKNPTDSAPLSITEYNFYSDNADNDGGTPQELYVLHGKETPLRASDGWEVDLSVHPDSEFHSSMLHTATPQGGKLRSKIEYAGDMDHPVKREEYVYAESQNAPLFVLTTFLCSAANHLYYPNSVVLSRKTEEVYDSSAALIYRNAEDYSVNDLGRLDGITRTDSRGDEICDRYTYLDAVPAYPTDAVRTANGKVVSAKRYDYVQLGDCEDHYVPSIVWTGATADDSPADAIAYRIDGSYSHYDAHGNPRQVTDRNGQHTCYIWGYGGRYPVAKIENSSYDILLGYGIETTYEGALPADIETQLRNDSEENFLVTTYTFEPLVGMTSMTDPTGHTTYYEYDDDGKLQRIRDAHGKTLKSYAYHIVTDNR